MKQYKARKLQLTKETVRALTRARLEEVAGGFNTTSHGASCETCVIGCPSVQC